MIKMEIVNGKYSNRAYYKLMRDLKKASLSCADHCSKSVMGRQHSVCLCWQLCGSVHLAPFLQPLAPCPTCFPSRQAPAQRGWQRPAPSALGPGMPPAGSALIGPVGLQYDVCLHFCFC